MLSVRDMPKPPIATGPAAARQDDRASGKEPTTSQREELQIILDSVPAFIWYKDRENRILRANRLAAESMGTTVADLEGRSTYDIYPEEAAEYHRDDLEVIRSGRPKLGILERLTIGSGEQRWIQTDKVPYRDQHGEIIGVIVFSVDVTERVEAETALREARDGLERRVEERTHELAAALDDLRRESGERLRAEERARQQQSQLAHLLRLHTVEGMAAQLAHEINQPLSAVANYASGLRRWLDKESLDLAAVRWAAEQISQQALRAAEIVRRQRDFVRKTPPRRDPCDVVQVVRDAVHLIEADARQQGVEIRVVQNPGLTPFGIDRIQIEQVVLNLLRNALEAMDERARRGARNRGPGRPAG